MKDSVTSQSHAAAMLRIVLFMSVWWERKVGSNFIFFYDSEFF